MSIERRNFPQFFITAPAPCPYLPGRVERKVFTHLVGQEARALNTQLSQGGFRRSQNIAYRPACDGCTACISVRVKADLFDFGGAAGRILKRNADLVGEITRARASSEHYSLFRDYIESRHGDGGMADMSVLDFSAMVDESFVDSRLVDFRFRSGHPEAGALVASVLIDILGDGLSMIYSFYRPDLPKRSLGTFMILDCIRKAQRLGLPYVYLGYWVQGSQKMNYKARFMPQERLTPDGWVLHTR